MTETLQEFCDWRGSPLGVDRHSGVIRGVKILGLESRNGRSYLPQALAQAAALYEDAKVNVNHPKSGPAAPRDYQDRIGVIHNVAARADGLFADFHFNPKHALAEQLAWDAEHAPENVGFSHNVEARTTRHGDRVVVEAIVRVTSVDLVADPATTRGLFEGEVAAKGDSPIFVERKLGQSPERKSGQSPLTLESLRRDYPELIEAIRREEAETRARLEAEVERLTALELAHAKQALARRLLAEHRLPDLDATDGHARTITSRRFLEALLAAPDEQAMRAMVEERASLVRALGGEGSAGRPLSRDQSLVDGPQRLDAKAFAEAIVG